MKRRSIGMGFWLVGFLIMGLLTGVSHAVGNPTEGTSTSRELININKADAKTLMRLPGIGPKIAERIVEYRKVHGPFRRKEELMNVPGIGRKKFDRIKDRITL